MVMNITVSNRYPKNKAVIKSAVKEGRLGDIYLAGTSIFGNEKSGPLDTLPAGLYTYVLNPATRSSFGNVRVTVNADGTRKYKFDN